MTRCFPGLVLLALAASGCYLSHAREAPAECRNRDCYAPDQCLELPPGAPRDVFVSYVARITAADVMLLVDTTGSMGAEIANIQSRLSGTIIPGLTAAVPDLAIGVAQFEDFPLAEYGFDTDRPFTLVQTATTEPRRAVEAVDRLTLGTGGDTPEAQVEALYQLATGDGLGSFIPPQDACPPGHIGAACFRPGATPIIVLVTDAEFHDGKDGTSPYVGVTPAPHRYGEAVDALAAIGAKVLPLSSGGDVPRRDVEAIAEDTGAVRRDGSPIVFDIGAEGAGLDTSLVRAVTSLVDEAPIDIDLVVGGGEALPGLRVVAFVASAGFAHGDRFDQVRPGTEVTFRLVLPELAPRPDARDITLQLTFRGDGATTLDERTIHVVIPGTETPATCPSRNP